MAPRDIPGPTVARSDPVGLREGDLKHCRSPVSTGLGSGSRVSPCDCSMMACSPLGERHPPVSRRTTVRLLGPAGVPATLPTRTASVEKRGREKNVLGFPWGTSHTRFWCAVTHAQPSIADGRFTAFWAGFWPRWAKWFLAQAFVAICGVHTGRARPELASGPIFRFKNFKFLSFSEIVNEFFN
jgi:hypothetical protein